MSVYLMDHHLHTEFSGDSFEKPENVIAAAKKCGLNSICFTDHLDFDYVAEGVLYELDKDDYFNSMSKYKEQTTNELAIYLGVETGLEPDKAFRLDDFINRHPYDFIIGSSHLVNGKDPYYPEFFQGKSKTEALMEYFESIVNNLKFCKNFDVYGHIDYCIRYSPEKEDYYDYMEFYDILKDILKTLIDNGKGIEVNTSGYRSGLPQPNPNFDIIKMYRELGGEIITVGSDAHKATDVGYRIKETTECLADCGFKYITVFKNRKPEFIKL